jgi:heterotetrameric sarcosine oxidase gamma subunit
VAEMLAVRPAFSGIAVPGRYGNDAGAPGVIISERVNLGLATLAARKGKAGDLAAAVRSAYGAVLPSGSTVDDSPTASFIGTAPGQWFVVSERLPNGALAEDLQARLGALASITDQSDGRGVIRVSGPRARAALAKGVPVDLHPSVFRPGSAATTVISLIGAQIWQVDDVPTYDIAVFRGYAGSFWHWLTASAAEFGYRIDPPYGG